MTNTQDKLIWCPPDIRDLITVSVEGDADESTVQGMHVINQAGLDWIKGDLEGEMYFDLLDSYGINPITFIGEARQRIDDVLR